MVTLCNRRGTLRLIQTSCTLLIMNNAELQSHLRELPDDLEVLVARDPEGNGFNKLYAGAVGVNYIEKNSDKHGHAEVIADEDAADYDEDELEQRLVIWP